jgi:hypothetical protein
MAQHIRKGFQDKFDGKGESYLKKKLYGKKQVFIKLYRAGKSAIVRRFKRRQ